jgi:hypothetical protein
MSQGQHSGALEQLVAPKSLAMFSLVIFLLAWLFPPALYTNYLVEPDLVFLDGASIIYYLLCVVGFVAGVVFIDHFFPARSPVVHEVQSKVPGILFLLVPLLAAMLFTVASCILTIKEYPGVVLALLSESGEDIKNSPLSLHTPLGLANTYLLGILWWVIWRSGELQLGKKSRILLGATVSLALLLCLIAATFKVSRFEVMLPIATTAVVYGTKEAHRRNVSRLRVLGYCAAFCAGMISIFVLFAAIRGGDTDSFLRTIIGYTLASYNRMCAVVHGRIRYEFGGHGVYLFTFLGFNNALNKIIPFARIFKWPDYYDWWQSEFTTTWNAGLNGNFIWSGTFGYMFADLGWFSPLWLLGEGALIGLLWRRMRRGATSGLLLYPWAASSIIFWFTTNGFVENDATVFVLELVMLSIYEAVFMVRIHDQHAIVSAVT